jgi:hypothetical protein
MNDLILRKVIRVYADTSVKHLFSLGGYQI